MVKPPRSILDRAFEYAPAKMHEGNADYLREKFRKLQREMQANQAEAKAKTVRIEGRRK